MGSLVELLGITPETEARLEAFAGVDAPELEAWKELAISPETFPANLTLSQIYWLRGGLRMVISHVVGMATQAKQLGELMKKAGVDVEVGMVDGGDENTEHGILEILAADETLGEIIVDHGMAQAMVMTPGTDDPFEIPAEWLTPTEPTEPPDGLLT